jgi:tRNA A-37 threonylcarbamoyl transferase component Bud32
VPGLKHVLSPVYEATKNSLKQPISYPDNAEGPHCEKDRDSFFPGTELVITKTLARGQLSVIHLAHVNTLKEPEHTGEEIAEKVQQLWSNDIVEEGADLTLDFNDGDSVMWGDVEDKTSAADEKSDSQSSDVTQSEYVVKYFNDCRERLHKHIVGAFTDAELDKRNEWEFRVLRALNDTGISPKVFYISPPLVLSKSSILPLPLRMQTEYLASHEKKCASKGTKIRYIVQQAVGPSIGMYISALSKNRLVYSSTEFTRKMLVIFQKVLDLIQKLHNKGFIHGDIHVYNIAFRQPVLGEIADIDIDNIDLVLIDFGLAKWFPESMGMDMRNDPIAMFELPLLNPRLLSLWQLRMDRAGRRDDVLRLLYMMADSMAKERLSDGIDNLISLNVKAFNNPIEGSPFYRKLELQACTFSREQCPIFEFSVPLASVMIVGDDKRFDEDTQNSIRRRLEFMHYRIKTIGHPDAEIDYSAIRGEITSLLQMFH